MRVAGWGEQSDATVIRPTYVVSSPPVSRVASMSQPICRAQKNQKLLDCLRKQGTPGAGEA
jgi:hypothetical protein